MPGAFIPVQIDIDVDTFKIRDSFVWNVNGAPELRILPIRALTQVFLTRRETHFAHVLRPCLL